MNNLKRSETVANALCNHEDYSEDKETVVADHLADVMHFCNVHGLDFDSAARRATNFFRDELSDPECELEASQEQTKRMGVRTEYEMNSVRKRDYLTVWSGSFFSVYEATGVSLPKMNGYMLTTYNDDRVKVTCPAPRNESNYLEVDEAISKALNEHYARIGASSIVTV